ncbi:MAG: hypothetical protein V8R52_07535 [Coprobacter fastidiosus]
MNTCLPVLSILPVTDNRSVVVIVVITNYKNGDVVDVNWSAFSAMLLKGECNWDYGGLWALERSA